MNTKPLPKPGSGESEEEFIARCNEVLADEYPEADQRNAVCYTQWRENRSAGAIHLKGFFDRSELKALRKDTDGEPIYRIVASTVDIDRDNEIVLPSAFAAKLPDYLKLNPVILFGHDHWSRPPIGKAVSGQVTDRALLLDIKFAPSPFAQEVRQMYEGGFMNTFSVGFMPIESNTDSEGRRVFTQVELLEVSAVPVPSNRLAVIMRAFDSRGKALQEIPRFYETTAKGTPAGSTPTPKGGTAESSPKKSLGLAEEYERRELKRLRYGGDTR